MKFDPNRRGTLVSLSASVVAPRSSRTATGCPQGSQDGQQEAGPDTGALL